MILGANEVLRNAMGAWEGWSGVGLGVVLDVKFPGKKVLHNT